MRRVGVFVCHCGTNIGGVVDCARVAKAAGEFPGVEYAINYEYMCSQSGQDMISKAVAEQRLDRIVVAACSPRMHENTFRKCLEKAGLNAYCLEMANIREQCSWVHSNEKEKATEKATDLVKMAVAKAVKNEPLQKETIPVTDRALVIGGGIAGIQAAIDLANAGHLVDIVEKEPSIGGKMAQLDKTFPTLDCSACILTPKMVEASVHPNINLITYSEVEKVDGFVGNFDVTIRKKARSIKMDACTGCGNCMEKCPVKVDSEFELGMAERKAIYTPFPQAVPNKPVIDRRHCSYFQEGKCAICQKVCAAGAVDYTQADELLAGRYGAIIVATGFELFDYSVYGEYGYGKYPDVITGLQFERLVNDSGPTLGKIRRPSDRKEPKNVVFIKCVGSRDSAKGKSYCSKTCCMYTAKQAILVHEKIKDANVYIFYQDIRTAGKGYDEFYNRTREEYGANYIRGRVAKIYPKGDKLIVCGEDTLISRPVEIEADLVVLATAMIAQPNAASLAQTINIGYDNDNFYMEAHPKLAPVETHTPGVFLAGACQGPKDIAESVAQAGAAAAKACGLLAKTEMLTEPIVSVVDENVCAGCEMCLPVCPNKAIEMKTVGKRSNGRVYERRVAAINSGLCQGCGACTVNCRSAAISLKHFTDEQILAEVNVLCL